MNKKGFTLVELLVMLVVLGILIGITVPNITGIIKDNKNSMTLDDANRMLDSAKVKATMNEKIINTLNDDGDCSILRLSYLDKNEDYKKGPNDGEYLKDESFVIIRLNEQYNFDGTTTEELEYFVRLIEKKGDDLYGVNIAPAKLIEKKEKTVLKTPPTLLNIGMTQLEENNDETKNQVEKINNLLQEKSCQDVKNDIK